MGKFFRMFSVAAALICCGAAFAAELPDISTLDSNWAKSALKFSSCGFQDVPADKIAKVSYLGKGGAGRIAWPWRNRLIEFEMPTETEVSRIVLTLDKLNVVGDTFDNNINNVQLFISSDGKKWQQTPCSESLKIYRSGKTPVAYYTLSGNFVARYFRMYIRFTKRIYIYGPSGLDRNLKVFGSGKSAVLNFEVTGSSTGKASAQFTISGTSKTSGRVFIRQKNSDKELFSRKFSELPDGKSFTAEFDLPANSGRFVDLELVSCEDKVKTPFIRNARCRLNCSDKVLTAPKFTGNIKETESVIGGRTMKFMRSSRRGDKIEYTVPADGDFIVYAFLRGKGKFSVQGGSLKCTAAMQTWHPFDITDDIAGENFLGIGKFKAGDKLVFTALQPNSALGEVKLAAAAADDLAVYNAPKEIVPAVIQHADGYSGFFASELTADKLRKNLDNLARVHTMEFDWCIGTTAVNYPSKVTDMFGCQRSVKFYRQGDRRAAERLKRFIATGTDPITVQREHTRKLGLSFSITLRANPFYNAGMNSMNSQYLIDHPEFYIKNAQGQRVRQPSYAYKEVRNFYMGLIREIAAFKPDTVTIEFLRHPPFFGYDQPIIDEYIKRHGKCTPADYMNDKYQKILCDVMFDHVKEARAVIDAVDPKIKLAINFDWKKYYEHGLDVERMLEAGLIDVISPGHYEIGNQKIFALAPFKAMIKKSPRPVKLIPRVEGTIYGGDPTPAEEQGLVKIQRKSCSLNMHKAIFLHFLNEGADGVRPFNSGGPWLSQALADRSGLRKFERFEMPLLDIRFYGK